MDAPMQSHSTHRHEPLHPLFSQKTISRPVAVSGVRIHTGKSIHLELHPAPEGSGIVFRRLDSCRGASPGLPPVGCPLEHDASISRAAVTISTVEHLRAS